MTVELKHIKKLFPKQEDCISFLEHYTWGNKPTCPYCNPELQVYAISKMGQRYHCNGCNSSFSVTAKTIFARTRCDLRKWFLAIYIQANPSTKLSARDLGSKIKTTKDTALLLSDKIRKASIENPSLIAIIINHINTQLNNGKNS